MTDDTGSDGALRGAERREDPSGRYPSWALPVVAAVIGAAAILINGWFAYVASSSKELVEARNETLQRRLDGINNRFDQLADRLTHLERIRMSEVGNPDEPTENNVARR